MNCSPYVQCDTSQKRGISVKVYEEGEVLLEASSSWDFGSFCLKKKL